jgi:hypothetical protein
VIRLFNVYYPVRTLVLLLGEALVIGFFVFTGNSVHGREHAAPE